MKLFTAIITLSLLAAVAALPVRFNLGATQPWDDADGNRWEPDNFTTGTTVAECPGPFFWTNQAALVCSRKEWKSSSGDLEIPVPEVGFYEAVLYFSEARGAVGDRVMDVSVEGQVVREDIDVVAVTGYPTGYFRLTVRYWISDSSFTISISSKTGKPTLAAIQLTAFSSAQSPVAPPSPVPTLPPPPTHQLPTSWFVNVGSSEAYLNGSGQVWRSDTISSGMAVDDCSTFSFQGLDNPGLLCKHREWDKSSGEIEFPVAPGSYRVRLYFSETSAAPGERLVDVYFENQKLVRGMDVANKIGGSYGLYTLSVTGYIGDGAISIRLEATTGFPVLAAVEIVDPNAPPTAPATSPPITTSTPTSSPTQRPTPIPTTPITKSTAPPTVLESTTLPTSAQPTAAPFSLRVNSGSFETYIDADGNTWEADRDFRGGSTFAACPAEIPSTKNAMIYCSERWGNPSYNVTVPTGRFYKVVTHFAEIFCKFILDVVCASNLPRLDADQEAGLRVFNVLVNGEPKLTLDIVAEVGPLEAFTFETVVEDLNGAITVDLDGVFENPKISGFEIFELSNFVPPTVSPTTTPDEVLINCGGGAYVDTLGRSWSADKYSSLGAAYTDTSNDIIGTEDDYLYHSERYGEFRYEIPIGNGSYNVSLHFAELIFTEENERVFKVNVERAVDFPAVDIVKLGGGQRLTAVKLTAPNVEVRDGFLTISLDNMFPSKDNAKISMIEVKRATGRRMLRTRE